MSTDASLIQVVAGVMDGAEVGEVFAFRRAENQREAGRWEFPGGKLEPGESPQEALRRELQEELALSVVVGERLWSGTEGPIQVTFYRVDRADQVPRLDVHDAVQSISVNEPPKLAWASVDREFVWQLPLLSRGPLWSILD